MYNVWLEYLEFVWKTSVYVIITIFLKDAEEKTGN